jgi:hypothetical protein
VNSDQLAMVRRALECSWSARTSYCYNSDIAPPSYGQCAPTAIVIWETFGGEILKTDGLPTFSGRHFYNRINGIRHDFTADQFDIPGYSHKVDYKDIPSSADEAATETTAGQVEEMRSAFKPALEAENAGLRHGRGHHADT